MSSGKALKIKCFPFFRLQHTPLPIPNSLATLQADLPLAISIMACLYKS
jgi:hypothetical protein